MNKSKKIVVLIALSTTLLAGIFFLLLFSKFDQRLSYENFYVYEGDSDNNLIFIKFDQEQKVIVTNYEAREKFYLYELHKFENDSDFDIRFNRISAPVLEQVFGGTVKGKIKLGEIELSNEQETFTIREIDSKEKEQLLGEYKGRIYELNSVLKKDEELLGASEEVQSLQENIGLLDEKIFNNSTPLSDASAVIKDKTSELKELIEAFKKDNAPEKVFNKKDCDDPDKLNFYCDILSVKEYLVNEYGSLSNNEQKIEDDIESLKELLADYNNKLDEFNFNPHISYDEEYLNYIEEEVAKDIEEFDKALSELEELFINFEEKYVK